jgi:proline dehydrogenase
VIATLGRGHIAGPDITDAVRVAEEEARAGAQLTLGRWSPKGAPPTEVVAGHEEAILAIAAARLPASVSVKLPELAYDEELFAGLLDFAAARGVSVHLDSLHVDSAVPTFERVRDVVADHPDIGCTLPGRWERSVRDAEALARMGVRSVRVVKGQWADPDDPRRDPARGVLEVVDALRGSGIDVGVATHDERVAYAALDRLLDARTPCHLEQLYGLPRLDVGAVRRRFGIGPLVYVPYGEAYLPYALTQALRHPKILLWAARDLIGLRSGHQRGGPRASV